jgi:hypothetical protein
MRLYLVHSTYIHTPKGVYMNIKITHRCQIDRLSPTDKHYAFYLALKEGKSIKRVDTLNNITETLTPEIIRSRHSCLCGILLYGYTSLSIIEH